jgi:hypothetical protein
LKSTNPTVRNALVYGGRQAISELVDEVMRGAPAIEGLGFFAMSFKAFAAAELANARVATQAQAWRAGQLPTP